MRASPLFLATFVAIAVALPIRSANGSPDAVNEADSDAGADTAAFEFDTMVVTATRRSRAVIDVPNTVDVIDRAQMDRHLVHDLKSLFRYEPGISVGESFGRFGIGDIRVRGLGGNRVRIQTDGIAVSDAFSIGSFSNANRNFVDVDTLKQVEVVRGPTSSLYGSDALGGTVAFITRDPDDYLKDGRNSYFGFRLGGESSWDGLLGSATAAFGSTHWSGMLAVGHRQGNERENMGRVGGEGSVRSKPNPQQRDGRSVLAKLVHAPDERQRFRMTLDANEDAADTDLLTDRGLQPLTRALNDKVIARDRQRRVRWSLDHTLALDEAFIDHVDWKLYHQDTRTRQYTREDRSGLPMPVLRDRRERWFQFEQKTDGLQVNFAKTLEHGALRHDLSWGLDVARTDTAQKRDGLRTFLLTGVTTSAMLPDIFPVRDFPLSRTTTAAIYLQDEMAFAGERLRLVPALRIDRYRLRATPDAIFSEDNPDVANVGLDKTSVSPKLGVVWRFAGDWSLYGGYSRGFRAPPYNDVNIGFTNVQFGYTAISNPDLKPETSDGAELGMRFANRALSASVAGYYNRYRDFIESTRFIGINDDGLQVFQSQNVARARIYGAELKAALNVGEWSDHWQGWSLQGAAAWSRGDDRTAGVPLESVDPLTASLGIAYDRDRWGAEVAGRFAARRDRLPAAPPPQSGADTTAYFESPGYGLLDLYAHWSFSPGARLDVAVLNLADRRYWDAGNVALVATTSRTLDRYTSPGRSLSLSFSAHW